MLFRISQVVLWSKIKYKVILITYNVTEYQ